MVKEEVTVQIWKTIMWHRFSVVLAVVTVGGISGVGGFNPLSQPISTLFTPAVEASEMSEDTVAKTYVQRNRRGTGRRGRLG
ncbi:hypothetical protein IQ265_16860 [Nodosilinea sp. LEGE 06152]|uniref:hypothetical protein n=1 Tax=Nodosilinea sp. LEGE 06152 TaxID=2777966 RepID=UPI001882E458|nr:hypothetical protein [Nodosilinea sp. LEGE 06152]MBE9158490.1 hypothetical protein [Nodosilinea sp. LEGE 06152]